MASNLKENPIAHRTCALVLALGLLSFSNIAQADPPWPIEAERSTPRLTPKRELTTSLNFGGAYVPQVGNLSEDSTTITEGNLIWNLALFYKFALFGQHTITKMNLGNTALINLGCELGFRYAPAKHLTIESAYMTHRLDRVIIGDNEIRPGGVIDYGLEIGAWVHFQPMDRLRIDIHGIGRIFDVYLDTQGVIGLGLRTSLLPFDNHSIQLEITILRVERADPRVGVEQITWNTLAGIQWRSALTERFGLTLGVLISTNLLVGQVPMLELKRSMINEPMGLATIGMFFRI